MPGPAQLDETQEAVRTPGSRRIWLGLIVLVALLLMALLPPYLNVNRYQRRIAESISQSLGRRVRVDHVTLNLLPVPGFTLENFVVGEDPAFGSEPTMRADSVRATLRVSSLWRRRIEFSTISLTDPSINIVHTAEGAWNLDSILLQAAHLESAPTAQPTAGPAPRFPYIEATGARLNLKLGEVKVPFALTDADLALWLPSPQVWHFRITARPQRTDVPAGYAGLLHLDGTLGRAARIEAIPIDLHGEWKAAPVGELSRILLGQDAGWRGEATMTASVLGTVGSNNLHARLRVADVRRADFVPAHLLSVNMECTATLADAFHAVHQARCAVPDGDSAKPPVLSVAGELGDMRDRRMSLQAEAPATPAASAVDLLHTLSQRVPEGIALGGTLSGSMRFETGDAADSGPTLSGGMLFKGGTVAASADEKKPIAVGDMALRAAGDGVAEDSRKTPGKKAAREKRPVDAGNAKALVLLPTTLALGAREPAVLTGRFDAGGYTLHLAGAATQERLKELAALIPQLGDGLQSALSPAALEGSAPIRLDLNATRAWGKPQTWSETAAAPSRSRTRRR